MGQLLARAAEGSFPPKARWLRSIESIAHCHPPANGPRGWWTVPTRHGREGAQAHAAAGVAVCRCRAHCHCQRWTSATPCAAAAGSRHRRAARAPSGSPTARAGEARRGQASDREKEKMRRKMRHPESELEREKKRARERSERIQPQERQSLWHWQEPHLPLSHSSPLAADSPSLRICGHRHNRSTEQSEHEDGSSIHRVAV